MIRFYKFIKYNCVEMVQ